MIFLVYESYTLVSSVNFWINCRILLARNLASAIILFQMELSKIRDAIYNCHITGRIQIKILTTLPFLPPAYLGMSLCPHGPSPSHNTSNHLSHVLSWRGFTPFPSLPQVLCPFLGVPHLHIYSHWSHVISAGTPVPGRGYPNPS